MYGTSISRPQLTHADKEKLTFENVVLKGLAADGGLFLPHEIPEATEWVRTNNPMPILHMFPDGDRRATLVHFSD